jgi:hypothetical protein
MKELVGTTIYNYVFKRHTDLFCPNVKVSDSFFQTDINVGDKVILGTESGYFHLFEGTVSHISSSSITVESNSNLRIPHIDGNHLTQYESIPFRLDKKESNR